MNKRFPLPKQYWIYVFICIVCACLLFGNIFRTDSWTGDMPFSKFTQREWKLFIVFVIEELVIFFVMLGFSFLAGKIYKKREQAIIADREQNKFADIKPGDYDYVWFDFSFVERALIIKRNEIYILNVHAYDEHSRKWEDLEHTSTYMSLEKLKEDLFYEFDFYCEANAKLDKYGEAIFKET